MHAQFLYKTTYELAEQYLFLPSLQSSFEHGGLHNDFLDFFLMGVGDGTGDKELDSTDAEVEEKQLEYPSTEVEAVEDCVGMGDGSGVDATISSIKKKSSL